MKEEKNDHLSREEQAMEAFINHLTFYVIVMAIIWLSWLLTNTPDRYPWPVYPTVAWGMGVFVNYLNVHRMTKPHKKHHEHVRAG